MITGLHHITLVCNDAQRTVDFYTQILGLRLVKQTVNFDDPGAYHLYFGNEAGTPGSIITFFEWKGSPRGHWGYGGTHHFALETRDEGTLLQWKRWLTDHGLRVEGPLDRHYFKSLYFTDPDGTIIEIATRGPGWAIDENADALGQLELDPPEEMTIRNRDRASIEAATHPEPVLEISADMRLERMHHITAIGLSIERSHRFYSDILGLRLLKKTRNFDDPTQPHWYWGVGDGAPGTIITYFQMDAARAPRVQHGAGMAHHFAFAVPDEQTQLEFREKLLEAGRDVSPVMERTYFKSIYTRDFDGHIVEIATTPPGFAVDEPLETMGSRLMLPDWLEGQRGSIEKKLKKLEVKQ
jgi:glyoxalase family protein